MVDNVLELVLGVTWAELPGVGVHCESHDGLFVRLPFLFIPLDAYNSSGDARVFFPPR